MRPDGALLPEGGAEACTGNRGPRGGGASIMGGMPGGGPPTDGGAPKLVALDMPMGGGMPGGRPWGRGGPIDIPGPIIMCGGAPTGIIMGGRMPESIPGIILGMGGAPSVVWLKIFKFVSGAGGGLYPSGVCAIAAGFTMTPSGTPSMYSGGMPSIPNIGMVGSPRPSLAPITAVKVSL